MQEEKQQTIENDIGQDAVGVPKRPLGISSVETLEMTKRKRKEKTALLERPYYKWELNELLFLVHWLKTAVETGETYHLRFCYHTVYLLEDKHDWLMEVSSDYSETCSKMSSWLQARKRKKLGSGVEMQEKELAFLMSFHEASRLYWWGSVSQKHFFTTDCLELFKTWFTMEWAQWIAVAGSDDERQSVRYILYNRRKLALRNQRKVQILEKGKEAVLENDRLIEEVTRKDRRLVLVSMELEQLQKEHQRLKLRQEILEQEQVNLTLEEQNTADDARITSYFDAARDSMKAQKHLQEKEEYILRLELDVAHCNEFIQKVYELVSNLVTQIHSSDDEDKPLIAKDSTSGWLDFLETYPSLGDDANTVVHMSSDRITSEQESSIVDVKDVYFLQDMGYSISRLFDGIMNDGLHCRYGKMGSKSTYAFDSTRDYSETSYDYNIDEYHYEGANDDESPGPVIEHQERDFNPNESSRCQLSQDAKDRITKMEYDYATLLADRNMEKVKVEHLQSRVQQLTVDLQNAIRIPYFPAMIQYVPYAVAVNNPNTNNEGTMMKEMYSSVNTKLQNLHNEQRELADANSKLKNWQINVRMKCNQENPTMEWLLKFSVAWMCIQRLEALLHYYHRENDILSDKEKHDLKSLEFYLSRLPQHLRKFHRDKDLFELMNKLKHPKGDLKWREGALNPDNSTVDMLVGYCHWISMAHLDHLMRICGEISDEIANELNKDRLSFWNREISIYVSNRVTFDYDIVG